MANVELLRKIREIVTEKPELWDQTKWAQRPDDSDAVEGTCGTTMCVAGWACHLSGEEIDWTDTMPEAGKDVASRLTSGTYIEDAAVSYLDISREDANALFFSTDATALEYLDDLINLGYIPS